MRTRAKDDRKRLEQMIAVLERFKTLRPRAARALAPVEVQGADLGKLEHYHPDARLAVLMCATESELERYVSSLNAPVDSWDSYDQRASQANQERRGHRPQSASRRRREILVPIARELLQDEWTIPEVTALILERDLWAEHPCPATSNWWSTDGRDLAGVLRHDLSDRRL